MSYKTRFEKPCTMLADMQKELSPENNCPVPAGILLIIGGKEEKQATESYEDGNKDKGTNEILKRFISLTEKSNPVIEVISTGTAEPQTSFDAYCKLFKQLGASVVNHIFHLNRKAALDDELAERIAAADAFFFTGGDQLKLTSIYGGTLFLKQIKERYIHEPVVIAGTSAGAMALSTPMIYAGNKDVQQTNGAVKITTGLEFLKDVCIDTHFIDRSRFVRIAQVIATNPTCIGIGIEEDSAIIVRNGQDAEMAGNGLITVVEGFEITGSNMAEFGNGEQVCLQNLKVHLLNSGSHYTIPQINPPHK